MQNHRQFAPAAYLVGILLFVIPFFDALTSIAPWHLGAPEWRFAAAGLVSNAFMIPASGALIIVGTALAFAHYRSQLWIGLFMWLVALICAVAVLSFTLDAVQTRNAIRPEMMLSFRVATATAEAKLVFAAISFGLLGRACRLERWTKKWVDQWVRKRSSGPARR